MKTSEKTRQLLREMRAAGVTCLIEGPSRQCHCFRDVGVSSDALYLAKQPGERDDDHIRRAYESVKLLGWLR